MFTNNVLKNVDNISYSFKIFRQVAKTCMGRCLSFSCFVLSDNKSENLL